MAYRKPIALGEWYHCYNRGVDKRATFKDDADYDRLLLLLYLCNGSVPIHISNLKESNLQKILLDPSIDRGEQIVEIGSYALMPNHLHIVLKEITEGGITAFMQRVSTGFTMFFNKKYERTGPLFTGPFKSKHAHDDLYIKHLVAYVHLNPAKLFDPRWKEGAANPSTIKERLLEYQYSSLSDFLCKDRPERKILGDSIFELFDSTQTLDEIIADANAYYAELSEARP